MRTLRARIGAIIVVAVVIIGACKFTSPPATDGGGPLGTDDAPQLQDAYVPDASACNAVSSECAGPTLRECQAIGQQPVDTPCSWGCSATPAPHCAKLQPSGGALTAADLDPNAELDDKELIGANTRIDTDTGAIGNGIQRLPGTGINNGIEYFQRGNVGVFRFKKLELSGTRFEITGNRALAIVALEGVTINARLDLTGDCIDNEAGPGGFGGGAANQTGSGSGAGGSGTAGGSGANTVASGGGGGGFGGSGGSGGEGDDGGGQGGNDEDGGTRGTTYGTVLIGALQGGAGGGGGGGTNGGRGGGGGGAIQIASNGPIRMAILGIDAGGCGGRGTAVNSNAGGGGGGAGGAILLEAPAIEVAAQTFLTVNGGGGGGADTNQNRDGEVGREDATRANGGNSGNQGGNGGSGAAGTTLEGSTGEQSRYAGGGGGGVGWIRINTISAETAQISDNARVSPSLNAGGTTATRGLAIVQ